MGWSKFWGQLKGCNCFPKKRHGRYGRRPRQPVEPTPRENTEHDPREEAGDLRFEGIDLMKTTNRKDHGTSLYDNKSLIVRRGDEFRIKINLSDAYNKETDTIVLHLTTGENPTIANGTRVWISSKKDGNWKMEVEGQGKTLELAITPEPRAAIGEYKVMVETRREKSSGHTQFQKKRIAEEMIVLFNPFCKDDDVYLADSQEIDEYVLNDSGRIFTGGSYGRPWTFGQFEPNVLECALYLMDRKFSKTPRSRGNICHVLRGMSAMVNSSDDNGVLTGNWSGDYEGGTSPSKWRGSVKIIQQYMKTKTDVKYGQCWVFAAVLTTICRALGIPTRPVTNFSSAHDTNGSCTIDKIIGPDGRPRDGGDSVWNFHVWNEAWCKRPDLTGEYKDSGWQAFDSTPQETSDGDYQCGPCPVSAIKNGEISTLYDAPFIFSEVNADRVYWQMDSNGDYKIINVDTYDVGRDMSTKAVGKSNNWRQDVTKNYKSKESSAAERLAVRNAVRAAVANGTLIENWKEKYNEGKDDPLDIHIRGSIQKNGDCQFTLNVENKEDKERTYIINMDMSAKYTDGAIGEILESFMEERTISPGKDETVTWDVPAQNYYADMDDDAWITLWAKAHVKDTGNFMTRSGVFHSDKPELELSVSKENVKVGEEFDVTIKFTNPISVKLTDCDLDLEGPGIQKSKDIKISKVLESNATIEQTIRLKAKVPGEREVAATFYSKELQGIGGAKLITVTE